MKPQSVDTKSRSYLFKNGFTIIELLVVIGIIGALAAVIIPSMNSSRNKARVAAGKKLDQSIRHSIGASLVGSYEFDECSGTAIKDLAGYADGSLRGGASWSTDAPLQTGCSVSVSNSRYLLTGNASEQDAGLGSMTWTLWFKANTSGVQQTMYFNANGGNVGGVNIILTNAGYVSCTVGTTGASVYATTPQKFNDGYWHHTACTLDRQANTLRLHVDGTLKSSASAASLVGIDLSNSYPVQVGAGGVSYSLDVDALRIYAASFPEVY